MSDAKMEQHRYLWMELDLVEMMTFVGCMVAVNSLVFVLCGALELVERYDLFTALKIHKTVSTLTALLEAAYLLNC